jgi:two-component system sensor histidine kinase HydH
MRDQGERLVQAETLSVVGEMAAAVAHSIRNPLSSIRSAAELAFEEDESVVHRCLHNITSQADRIDEWLRELLAACRGGLVPIEKIDLNVILRDTIAGASADIKRRRIELKVIATSRPAVRGTRAPLAHAIRSVISNAVEAMPGGGILRVESRAEDGEAQIVIEDSGIGMAPEVARKAFRPLFTTKPNGVGLGLALARRILERHAGRIELHSAVGQGTRVTLNLPLET